MLSSFAMASSAQAACPNEAIRIEQGSTYLPDCMALEQATPPVKGSSGTRVPSFSANGERLLFRSSARLGDSTSYVNALGDLYVAERGPEGWSTKATTAPGVFGFGESASDTPLAFSPDFGSWVSFESTEPQFSLGEATLFEGTTTNSWTARSSLLQVLLPSGVRSLGEEYARRSRQVVGALPNLSLVVFKAGSEGTYLPGDPPVPGLEGVFIPSNAYVINGGPGGDSTLELLARDASGTVWGGNCGAWLGGGGSSKVPGGRNQGAISADGLRMLFSTRPGQSWDAETHEGPNCEAARPVRIMVRDQTPVGPQISELLPAGPATGSDFFEGASEDQSRIYFTSSRALSATDLDAGAEECSGTVGASKGCDLYLDESSPTGHRIVQVSAGGVGDPTPGEGADVIKGVTAISGDGSHVYYVAQGVLTAQPNPVGAVAEAGKPNLYVYDAGTESTAFIGVLAAADSGRLYGSEGGYNGYAEAVPMLDESGARQVGGDGDLLVFQSAASLTADDTDGGRVDIYRYDAAAMSPTLECVSCRPGGPDPEPFDVVGRGHLAPHADNIGPEFAEWQRWVSEDGGRIVLATKERLLPEDTDGELSDYLWQEGRLSLLPGNGEEPVISHTGEEVAFETPRVLLPNDVDTASDIYVARKDGGFSTLPQVTPCAGEACQGRGASQPAPTNAGTATFEGAGNAKTGGRHPREHHKHKKRKHKKHKRHHRHKQKHRHEKRAGARQGGGK